MVPKRIQQYRFALEYKLHFRDQICFVKIAVSLTNRPSFVPHERERLEV